MTAMDEIRELMKIKFAGLSYPDIRDLTTLNKTTVRRFMVGELATSKTVATVMSKLHGGEFTRLLKEWRNEKHINTIRALERAEGIKRADMAFPSPSHFVQMPDSFTQVETHHLIDMAILPKHLHGMVGYTA